MDQDTEKLAETLDYILSHYDGDPNDRGWNKAKELLLKLKPRPMFLECPSCGTLHVDEGELKTKPHVEHRCTECGHQWKPHAYPTVGIGIQGMDSKETTGFLSFFIGFLDRTEQSGNVLSENQKQGIRMTLETGWKAGRDYWISRHVKAGPIQETLPPQPDEDDPGEIPEPDEQIAEAIKSGHLTRDDIVDLGLDPRSYGLDTEEEEHIGEDGSEEEVTAEEVGITFDEGTE